MKTGSYYIITLTYIDGETHQQRAERVKPYRTALRGARLEFSTEAEALKRLERYEAYLNIPKGMYEVCEAFNL